MKLSFICGIRILFVELESYTMCMTRPLNYNNTFLIVMAKKYYFNRDRWLTHKKHEIVRLAPEIDGDIPKIVKNGNHLVVNKCYFFITIAVLKKRRVFFIPSLSNTLT